MARGVLNALTRESKAIAKTMRTKVLINLNYYNKQDNHFLIDSSFIFTSNN